MVQMVKKKNLSAMQETGVRSLGGEDFLERGVATYSSILAWRRALSGFCGESRFPASGRGSAPQRCCTGKERNSPKSCFNLAPWLSMHLRITEDLSPFLSGTSSGRHSPAAELSS